MNNKNRISWTITKTWKLNMTNESHKGKSWEFQNDLVSFVFKMNIHELKKLSWSKTSKKKEKKANDVCLAHRLFFKFHSMKNRVIFSRSFAAISSLKSHEDRRVSRCSVTLRLGTFQIFLSRHIWWRNNRSELWKAEGVKMEKLCQRDVRSLNRKFSTESSRDFRKPREGN